jgi:ABC-type uncharacterized transport system involved in gliding motility auxiliary subunit
VATGWMQTRQTKYAAYVTVYIIVILAIIVAANFLANRYNKSFDATANKRYSLSDQTKKVVGDLKQDVTIRYFDRSTGMQGAKDLLDRYATLSPKLHIEYVDLLKNPTLARAANVSREGEAVVEAGTRREDAKTFDEEGVTGALIRALKGGERKVCVVTGNGEHRLDDSSQGEGFSGFQTIVERNNYKVQALNLLQMKMPEVPADCTIMVVAGPSGDYLQPEVDAIKRYVEGGGRALFLLDPPLKLGRRQVGDNQALSDLLASWGVAVVGRRPGSAGDHAVRLAPHRQRSHQYLDRFPAFALARDQEHRQDQHQQAVLNIVGQLRHQQSEFGRDSYRPLQGQARAFHARRSRHL